MKFVFILVITLLYIGCTEELKTTETDSKAEAQSSMSTKSTGKEEAVQFWKLVAEGKVEESIKLANSLITEVKGDSDHYHLPLFKQEGVKQSFLTRKSFNQVDAFFWHQAQFIKSISRNTLTSDQDPVESLYNDVVMRFSIKSEAEDISSYPFHIWQRGFGACDRQAWVMCELVYQLGGKASVIYLRHPETKSSPHTICEVFYNKKHYLIDPLYQKFLPETKFSDLTPEKIKEVWSEKPILHNTFEKAVRLIPSMPVDYTERNQRLNARLGKIIKFGEPPQNRYHFWKSIYPDMDIRFWEYPIRILKNTKFYIDAEK